MLQLIRTKNSHPLLRATMQKHYSEPRGFVGRNLCYAVLYNGVYYGHTVGGSATRFLPNRNEFFQIDIEDLNCIVNNVFFHVERVGNSYPIRNFLPRIIRKFRQQISIEWQQKYGDVVLGFETLVELPRTGECYQRDGWEVIGTTKGYSCKRVAGRGTDTWGGKRVWDTKNLKPKLVLARKIVC